MILHSVGQASRVGQTVIGKLTSIPIAQVDLRRDFIAFAQSSQDLFAGDLSGYVGAFVPDGAVLQGAEHLPSVRGCGNLHYLRDGDVIAFYPSGVVNVLYRKSSFHNTILATERCNSLCLMCTQPPKTNDDSYRVREILRLIELVDPNCRELGISGGEPTLMGEDFFAIIDKCKRTLPATAVHVLTNGRLFVNRRMALRLGEIRHPDLMLGIPLYSDIDEKHDYVVQARGAFNETVIGLYHLAEAGVPIEIRIVIHALTYERLPQLAEFIYRNFPFASHVALMGMEMFGYVSLNLKTLWVDPVDYGEKLEEATTNLALRGMNTSIYNHQLCTIPKTIWPHTRKSISDWKNVYLPTCEGCGVKDLCGGFFQSATKKHSEHIHPLPELSYADREALLSRISPPLFESSDCSSEALRG